MAKLQFFKCGGTSEPPILCGIFTECIFVNGGVGTKIGFDRPYTGELLVKSVTRY